MTLGPRGHYTTKMKHPGRPSPPMKQHLEALRAGNWGCFRNAPLSLQRVGRQGCLRPSAELGTPFFGRLSPSPFPGGPGAPATPSSGRKDPHTGAAPEDRSAKASTRPGRRPQPRSICEILFIFVLMGEVQCQNAWFMSHANYSWARGVGGGWLKEGKRHQAEQQKEVCSKKK